MHWERHEENYVGMTWVGDAQVTYVVVPDEHAQGRHVVQRHVGGADKSTDVGSTTAPLLGKYIAEADAKELQAKGF